jgi:hypothetical protein
MQCNMASSPVDVGSSKVVKDVSRVVNEVVQKAVQCLWILALQFSHSMGVGTLETPGLITCQVGTALLFWSSCP